MVVQSESSCQVSVRASTCNFSSCISSLTSSILLLTYRMFRQPKLVKWLRCIACLEIRGQIRAGSLCCTEASRVLADGLRLCGRLTGRLPKMIRTPVEPDSVYTGAGRLCCPPLQPRIVRLVVINESINVRKGRGG